MADVNYSLPAFEKLLKPVASLQYAFASGDSDRESGSFVSQTNTAGSDNGFYYFGAFSGGLGLKPRLHNMHVARAGITVRPLYSNYNFRELLVGIKYSYYQKAVSAAPTSDANVERGANAKAALGQGIDANIVWDYRSDLKFFYGFGVFIPGEAYKAANRSNITTHLFSLTINL